MIAIAATTTLEFVSSTPHLLVFGLGIAIPSPYTYLSTLGPFVWLDRTAP